MLLPLRSFSCIHCFTFGCIMENEVLVNCFTSSGAWEDGMTSIHLMYHVCLENYFIPSVAKRGKRKQNVQTSYLGVQRDVLGIETTYFGNIGSRTCNFILYPNNKKFISNLPFKSGFLSTLVLFNLFTMSLIRFSTLTVRTWIVYKDKCS